MANKNNDRKMVILLLNRWQQSLKFLFCCRIKKYDLSKIKGYLAIDYTLTILDKL
mgnify:CR=1 FL=1